MTRPLLPLNALRAFEASARHLNLTRAADELCVSQAAISHHIKQLEERLGTVLFRRLPRGLALTDEGAALLPVLTGAFDQIEATLSRFADGRYTALLTVGAVGTFAAGWLMPRLPSFQAAHPDIDLRLFTHNNRVELAGEGIDLAIRFGDGDWSGVVATPLMRTPLAPLCAPALVERLRHPADLAGKVLLRSYRPDQWERWFAAAGLPAPAQHGPIFDSSPTMAMAAAAGHGIALLPPAMFEHDLSTGRLVQPFSTMIDVGAYWLTHLRSREVSPAMTAFAAWLIAAADDSRV
jgi:LysR family transcriptional regulator of beta-lactamase